ncbi:MAG TPA: DUF2891 domain-containing protein [Caulobacteraceae bacterium]
MNGVLALDAGLAGRLSQAALDHVEREYPYALVQVLGRPSDLGLPRKLHPVFFGSFDWHSCVHGYWLLARILRLYPGLPQSGAITGVFTRRFTASAMAGELAFIERPTSKGFERPYGWAWLLMLAAELRRPGVEDRQRWEAVLRPLSAAIAGRLINFLPKADYPVRAGAHSNTAFALALALDYAQVAGDAALAGAIRAKARQWYARDADCQAWEPSGDDFLSPALMEAELMRRVLTPKAFGVWFNRFLPLAGDAAPATLFRPARVSDRADGKIAHLDGLNLSRAWCWKGIASALAPDSPARARGLAAARRHIRASLPHVTGDYMGEHWLASFALLALTA